MPDGANDNVIGVHTFATQCTDEEYEVIQNMMKLGGVSDFSHLVAQAISLLNSCILSASEGKKIFEGELSGKTREVSEISELITPALQYAYRFRSRKKQIINGGPVVKRPTLSLVSARTQGDRDDDT